jgi:hypothetical protein
MMHVRNLWLMLLDQLWLFRFFLLRRLSALYFLNYFRITVARLMFTYEFPMVIGCIIKVLNGFFEHVIAKPNFELVYLALIR